MLGHHPESISGKTDMAKQALKTTTPAPHSLNIDGERVAIVVTINRRARRIILKVDGLERLIQVTCPGKSYQREALAFVKERKAWIADRLAEAPARRPFAPGEIIPVGGEPHLIAHAPGKRIGVRVQPATGRNPAVITVGGDANFVARKITDWLRQTAREKLTQETDKFCKVLNKRRRKVSVRDGRTRWGSCSSDGSLCYSWRLILAPPAVLSYVAAHEVSHLIHLDHSAKFWAVVDKICDNRKSAERWLTTKGPSLYGYGVAF